MTIKIRAIREKGNIEKERVVLECDSNEDMGKYLVALTLRTGDGIVSSNLRRTLWLPDHKVDAGDLVVIYSKVSNKSIKTKNNEDGTKTTFVYWGADKPIFESDDAGIILMRIDEWTFKNI